MKAAVGAPFAVGELDKKFIIGFPKYFKVAVGRRILRRGMGIQPGKDSVFIPGGGNFYNIFAARSNPCQPVAPETGRTGNVRVFAFAGTGL
jgi:hypothetical protein